MKEKRDEIQSKLERLTNYNDIQTIYNVCSLTLRQKRDIDGKLKYMRQRQIKFNLGNYLLEIARNADDTFLQSILLAASRNYKNYHVTYAKLEKLLFRTYGGYMKCGFNKPRLSYFGRHYAMLSRIYLKKNHHLSEYEKLRFGEPSYLVKDWGDDEHSVKLSCNEVELGNDPPSINMPGKKLSFPSKLPINDPLLDSYKDRLPTLKESDEIFPPYFEDLYTKLSLHTEVYLHG